VNFELFPPELDLGDRLESGDGCARPIGRHSPARGRIPRTRPRRPLTAAVLAEIRALVQDGLGDVSATLRRLERGARTQLDIQSVTADQLANVLARLVKIERHLELVETPQAPRISRRRPLDS
jgi:hypothetical protein